MDLENATSLEPLIRYYVHLPPYANQKGWFPVLCPICNDHGKKGPRAAFKFDGDATAYNCFNCGPDVTAVYDPDGQPTDMVSREGAHIPATISKKMETVLQAFGVPEDQYNRVILNNLERASPGNIKDKPQFKSLEPNVLSMPKYFYYLADAEPDDKWAQIATYYLEDRGVDPDSYPFMLAHKTKNEKLDKWLKRVIVPIYKDDNLIYYQGRALVDGIKKYENPTVDRNKILFGYNELMKRTDAPLYVTEGWFDGYSIGGVAVLGNQMMDEQIEILNRSRRTKVFIPDRFGDGIKVAQVALANGWSVSTPDIGGCKDMNEAVNKYGKLYVIKSLTENTVNGFEAETQLELYCEN